MGGGGDLKTVNFEKRNVLRYKYQKLLSRQCVPIRIQFSGNVLVGCVCVLALLLALFPLLGQHIINTTLTQHAHGKA
jgi:hypothetical protein